MYEHIFLENTKKLYKYTGKCDDQHQYKAILESEIFSNPEEFTDKSPVSLDQSEPVKNTSASKSLYLFSSVLDIKQKTYVCRLGATKSKPKSIRADNTLWLIISKRLRHTKTNQ